MNSVLTSCHLALPEMVVLITTCIALLGDLFFKKSNIAFTIALLGLVIAGCICYLFLGQTQTLIFNNLFISDDIGQLSKLFVCISVFLSFFYSFYYVREKNMPRGDYYVLGLFSTLGMMILISAHSLLTIYLGLELLSLPLYAMVAIKRNNADSSEASMKYFVMGAIASAMLLYGISMIYGATGELELTKIAGAIKSSSSHKLLIFGLVFILCGVGFKLAVVPFHMWAPDVYQGAPTTVTLFISTAPKIAALGMTLRLLLFAFPDLIKDWQQIILVMALLSTFIGNLIAIVQTNIKRLFAYSTVSHMGYVLFGVLAGNIQGYSAALYYALIYTLMSAGAFGLLVLLSRQGLEIQEIKDLKGLNKTNPWLAFMMLLVLFSMAGVPPTVGFFAKLLVLKALIDVNLIWVAVVGLIFAVIGAFYYIRIVKIMYFDAPKDTGFIALPWQMNVVFSLNCLSLLYLGVFPGVLINACMSAFQ